MTSTQISSWSEEYNGYELAFKLRRNDNGELKVGVYVYKTKLFGLVRWGKPLYKKAGEFWYDDPDSINAQIDALSDKAKKFIGTFESVDRS